MPVRGCLESILHPFSAVIKFQKEFTSDVLNNVRKQREVLHKHHREMALRRQELHLDELEEKYKCCVCGAKGKSRDFEPPPALVNAMADAVTAANDVVRQHGEKPTVTATQSDDHHRHVSFVVESPTDDAIASPGYDSERAAVTPVAAGACSDNAGGERSTDAAHGEAPPPEVDAVVQLDPMQVKELVLRAKREVINAQKLKRLEEKHKKEGSYHKDKGLMRIHETDVEAFSQFFHKPVRGFLCEQCHNSAKRRLDVLTSEIQAVLVRAADPFPRRNRNNPSAASTSAIAAGGALDLSAPSSYLSAAVAGLEVVEDANKQGFLSDEDIFTIRRLGLCGVCVHRKPTYFLRRSVLFLCSYCCAIDRFHRRSAICINDEIMSFDTCTLLESYAMHLRGEDETQTTQKKHVTESSARVFQPKRTLFTREFNLFGAQHMHLTTPKLAGRLYQRDGDGPRRVSHFPDPHQIDEPVDDAKGVGQQDDFEQNVQQTQVLLINPDFSEFMSQAEDGTTAWGTVQTDRNARARAVARSSGVSLFQGKQLKAGLDLFEEMSATSSSLPPFLGSPRNRNWEPSESSTKPDFSDFLGNLSSSERSSIGMTTLQAATPSSQPQPIELRDLATRGAEEATCRSSGSKVPSPSPSAAVDFHSCGAEAVSVTSQTSSEAHREKNSFATLLKDFRLAPAPALPGTVADSLPTVAAPEAADASPKGFEPDTRTHGFPSEFSSPSQPRVHDASSVTPGGFSNFSGFGFPSPPLDHGTDFVERSSRPTTDPSHLHADVVDAALNANVVVEDASMTETRHHEDIRTMADVNVDAATPGSTFTDFSGFGFPSPPPPPSAHPDNDNDNVGVVLPGGPKPLFDFSHTDEDDEGADTADREPQSFPRVTVAAPGPSRPTFNFGSDNDGDEDLR